MMKANKRGTANRRLTLELSCGKKSLRKARSRIRKFASQQGYTRESEDIALAAQEALKNIIQHGCPADDKMYLECVAMDDGFTVEVSDHGMGFNVEAYEEASASPMALHGRGIRIIKGLMDEVKITSGQEGTTVLMHKDRDRGTAPGR